MNVKRWMISTISAAAVFGVVAVASAADFKPFSQVENVCPECEKPKADVLSLSAGDQIRGTVVGENTDFYVVVRYGEIRAIAKDQVNKIDWADGAKPSGLADKDQIVLPNGHVLSGTIVKESDEPAFFQLKSSFDDTTFTVAKSRVASAYKGGSSYAFSTGGSSDKGDDSNAQ